MSSGKGSAEFEWFSSADEKIRLTHETSRSTLLHVSLYQEAYENNTVNVCSQRMSTIGNIYTSLYGP